MTTAACLAAGSTGDLTGAAMVFSAGLASLPAARALSARTALLMASAATAFAGAGLLSALFAVCGVAVLGTAVLASAPPRAAEFFTAEEARADDGAALRGSAAADFTPASFVLGLACVFTGAFVLVVAAVFAVWAADFTLFDAAVVPASAFAADLAVAAWADSFSVAFEALADCAGLAEAAGSAEPRERREAAETLAPFALSFFLADGIRGTLLLRPAVETGRTTDPSPSRDITAPPASLLF